MKITYVVCLNDGWDGVYFGEDLYKYGKGLHYYGHTLDLSVVLEGLVGKGYITGFEKIVISNTPIPFGKIPLTLTELNLIIGV